jgi:hypothetical protein
MADMTEQQLRISDQSNSQKNGDIKRLTLEMHDLQQQLKECEDQKQDM